MIIECKECGAPLDVEQNASLARCQYCGKTQRVRTARTHYPVTPPNWHPPAQWTPPVHYPARSVPLRYDASKKVGSIIAVIAVVTTLVPLVTVGAVMFTVHRATSDATTSPSPPRRPASPSPPVVPPIPKSGTSACAAAARCCQVVGAKGSGCENLAMVPDENVCQQVLDQLKDAAEQMGKSCD